MFRVSWRRGFTLYETLIYLALFFMLSTLVVGLVIQLLSNGFRMAREREVMSAITNAIDTVRYEARQASNVYAPTSVFGTATSQVSLATMSGSPYPDEATYVDFYVDGGRVYFRRENSPSLALTGKGVSIDAFKVTLMRPVSRAETLRLHIRAHHRSSPGNEDTALAVTTTVAIRRR